MPPLVTPPGSFFSSPPRDPPSRSMNADANHIKQARQATTPSLPSRSASARGINAPQHSDPPPVPPQHIKTTKLTDASVITIVTDGHVFDIPADIVERYRWVREQTIASYRAVTSGSATPRDLAFIFGDPSIPHLGAPPGVRDGGVEAGESSQNKGVKQTQTVHPQNRGDIAEDRGGSSVGRMRVADETSSAPPAPAKRGREVVEISDEEDEGEDPIRRSSRRIKHLPTAHSPLPNPPRVRHQPSTSINPPQPQPASRPPGFVRFDRRQYPMPNFVGHFTDYADAEASTGMARVWIMGKYIDGALSLGGKYAEAVAMGRV
ncbi:hypothetical protein P167DRAFT_566410 [Morchella conica CCBAS932]|uniref:Uncharacterized protein n=1 Tax=Morchella conica CCBAS932 TaxID=1392247 RepID=A0A3N4KJE7_9PEZI|nr:hypothetical protein P167DRAFT_566410 [Morchella conica CCBAS932]